MEEMLKKLNECKEVFENQPKNLRFTGKQIAYVFERFIQYTEEQIAKKKSTPKEGLDGKN